jgi:ketosteroid isomerase-like protein
VSRIDTVQHLFKASEANNIQEYVRFFTDDAEYQIGNAQPIVGPKAIEQLASDVMRTIQQVTHVIKSIWETADGTVVCHAQVMYARKDGKKFELPCVTIIRFTGDKIHKYQAFIDASPVFTYTQLEKVIAMESGAARGNWELFKSFLTEDIYFKVGDSKELVGPQALADYYQQVQSTELRITRVDTRGAWEVENAVIVEMDVQAELINDGNKVEYPSVDVFRFKDGKIQEWRAYPVHQHFVKTNM